MSVSYACEDRSKCKFVPVLNQTPRSESVWGVGEDVQLQALSTWALCRGEWLASRLVRITLMTPTADVKDLEEK
jgi:hypothetical protein